ncbi:hypothetical protein IQ06DRAFT_108082 [Phaeosphaeriaceae sp. SRC1lsM3a]|nr:hypothetical protein IQ06DRAFT_108082 [Stagonospora sp. SRC1lsM3a]
MFPDRSVAIIDASSLRCLISPDLFLDSSRSRGAPVLPGSVATISFSRCTGPCMQAQEARHSPRSESGVWRRPLCRTTLRQRICVLDLQLLLNRQLPPITGIIYGLVFFSSLPAPENDRFWEGDTPLLPVSVRPAVPRSSPFLHCTRPNSWASPLPRRPPVLHVPARAQTAHLAPPTGRLRPCLMAWRR